MLNRLIALYGVQQYWKQILILCTLCSNVMSFGSYKATAQNI